MTIVKTCGKLYWAGEYAILEPGQLALIKAIPIYMTADIKASNDYRLYSDMFSYSVDLRPDSSYTLIQETVALVEEYLTAQGVELHPFSLEIRGKMEREGKKFGLGSSGSVVVLVIKAMLAFYERLADRELLFKLASAVLLKRGDNGSMGDIACIVSENLVLYQSFDREKVAQWLEKEDLQAVLDRDWGFSIRSVEPVLKFDFLVGWTKEVAVSSYMVKQIKDNMNSSFLQASKETVANLVKALEVGQEETIIDLLEQASQLLEGLSSDIYTPSLRQLKNASRDLKAVAKSSGAGGGDCGIALSFDQDSTTLLKKRWADLGIELLYQERMEHDDKSEG
ncbi:phosphomevalonate kinase [Streptococcus infantis]|uniref:phosphomevalonate kinase n=1 Tax=Streptococcus infantis TaxID=68892 RepID=UPI00189B47B3|nr:phosphomevalonate kinase [Streptococcus infantis]